MNKFKKKPVVIEAVQYPCQHEALQRCSCDGINTGCTHCGKEYIQTLEGRMTVSDGDWIITGINGEHYPCKPDIFEKTYELALDETKGLTFGEALELMKKGYRVSRVEWNMNGMWLSLSCNPNGDAVSGRREIAFENFWSNNNSEYARQNGGSAAVLPCITMKTTTGEILFGWAPSQTDMLANDWVWLNEPVSE